MFFQMFFEIWQEAHETYNTISTGSSFSSSSLSAETRTCPLLVCRDSGKSLSNGDQNKVQNISGRDDTGNEFEKRTGFVIY